MISGSAMEEEMDFCTGKTYMTVKSELDSQNFLQVSDNVGLHIYCSYETGITHSCNQALKSVK